MLLLAFTIFLFGTILVSVVIHHVALFFFLRRLKPAEKDTSDADYTPKTMVFFPLRGADPSLPRSLEKILTQDYPNYHIQFILDSANDPARPFVEAAIAQHQRGGSPHAEIKVQQTRFSTCSLKCSALYHGVTDLDPSFEAVVVLDADTNPPRDWLGRLVKPLADPRFPAATGLRWYVPVQANAGSLVRYIWNAAAIVQQYLYRIPWGGSLALRRDLFTGSDLLEQWKHSFADDTLVKSAVQQMNGEVAFVPGLFLVNRETCGLLPFHRWVKRQLMCAELYHPSWRAVLFQAALLTVPLLLLAGTFFAGLIQQNGHVVLWSLMAFVLYWAGVFGALPLMEHSLRQIVRQHGETVEKWSFYRTILTFAMIPVTHVVYVSALFGLRSLRKVEWRGIEYEITGKQIRLVEYKPYTAKPAEEGQSL